MKAFATSNFSCRTNFAAAYSSAPLRNIMDTALLAVSIVIVLLLVALSA